MELFSHASRRERRGEPLAERMRPRAIEEVVGQRHLLAPGKLLERALATGNLPSLILWGPPGTGKTTLARLVAARVGAKFEAVSAVLGGVKELREALERARARLDERGERTVLFVDEIHRFNKGQQDALLPHVEAGTVVFVGATTENPSFEVNAALLSRARVLRLEPIGEDDLVGLLERALTDAERGVGKGGGAVPAVGRPQLARIARAAEGDARRALTGLEVACSMGREVDDATVDEALQGRVLRYDADGEEHYAVISAYIKSMRGSDPDAAVYWLARLVEAGEDPVFIGRRMVIFASEDVGNADPRALEVAVAALQAVRLVGLPEATFPLTQATLYLATAPKSNTALTAYAAAKAAVEARGALPVPGHLRNASDRTSKQLGWGKDYKYPHDHAGGYVEQRYLPDDLELEAYTPSGNGYEKTIAERLERWKRK